MEPLSQEDRPGSPGTAGNSLPRGVRSQGLRVTMSHSRAVPTQRKGFLYTKGPPRTLPGAPQG